MRSNRSCGRSLFSEFSIDFSLLSWYNPLRGKQERRPLQRSRLTLKWIVIEGMAAPVLRCGYFFFISVMIPRTTTAMNWMRSRTLTSTISSPLALCIQEVEPFRSCLRAYHSIRSTVCQALFHNFLNSLVTLMHDIL